MASRSTQIGHGLAKVLGIKLDYRNETGQPSVTRGESTFSVDSADNYVEQEPTSLEWLRSIAPSRHTAVDYVRSLFPFVQWLPKYNLQWLTGDLIAGITIGAVVVPQGMAYAKLAELDPQFGLYSSFMGVLIYWFFATSKDITIGPVAVMSKITGDVVLKVIDKRPDIPRHVVASDLAIIAGAIVCFLGLARLGWLVEFISLASICAYMTGSAINIAVGQVPALMGIKAPWSRDATYRVVINTLKNLGKTKMDAAMGLTALFLLYLIRFIFNYLARKRPDQKKTWFFCNTLRTVFVILLYTLISWLVNLHLPDHNSKKSPFKILGHVPRGFQDAGAPPINTEIIKTFASELPSSVIVLLIEHIAIAKSFGRVGNYTINPSQELVAIGVTNLLAPLVGGYPSTGSFSRTAIKAKAGVRTPLAGFITAIVVLLAIYALPAVFFYIPNATLSAVIIHAVGDLITPPNTLYQFWRVSPLEVVIFFAGVFVTIFSSIENGVYTTICCSAALLLYRVFRSNGYFLGKVQVHSVIGDHLLDGQDGNYGTTKSRPAPGNDPDKSTRNIFIPVHHEDGSNPVVHASHPYPGIFIYRFSEGFNYPNANHYLDYMTDVVFESTRRTNPHAYARLGDRPWNDPGTSRSQTEVVEEDKPTLKAIILDFSSVNNVDITSVQNLIDVRNQLDRYASPEKVQWHFACVHNRWTKRALVSAGFGYPSFEEEGFHRWKPLFSVAELGGADSAAAAAEDAANRRASKQQGRDLETGGGARAPSAAQRDSIATPESASSSDSIEKGQDTKEWYGKSLPEGRTAVVQGLNRPLFHLDLTIALQSAINWVQTHEAAQHQQRPAGLDGKGPTEFVS